MKGLILCAGRGTRLYPLSYSQPKTLLPVANHPVLYYCIQKLVESGIHEIGIVIHPSQSQIKEYVGDGSRFSAKLHFFEQAQPLGIAHAVKQARDFLQDSPFLLLLGDNLLMDSLAQLRATFEAAQADCSILLRQVDRPQDYGIAELKDGQIVSITEKPKQPKSNLAVIGAYLFTPDIFTIIDTLQPSARGEYEITDAIQGLLLQNRKITYAITHGDYSDVGTIERWLSANRWMLEKRFGKEISVGATSIVENCELIGPVVIGEGCVIRNSKIGPYVSIQDGAELINCYEIRDSILLEKTSMIDIDWEVQRSVFGRSSQMVGKPQEHNGIFIVSDRSYILFPQTKKRSEP
ncbi:glucose-1-phosphate thymidylyltransferase [Brevibacillus fluminis]|uniref:glucose-1-phosphate thymidylyltransferase n=1 Tax=Brevibacillus fluminis TaxID=511487 RepID=UPI003F8A2CAB